MKRRQKAGFLCAISSRITLTKEKKRIGEKERARRKEGGEEKKAMVALLVFIMATLDFLAEKRLLDRKSPSSGNVFKNPARYIFSFLLLLSFPLM